MDKAVSAKRKNDLTQGSIFKKLALFTLPILGSQLIQQLYNTVDVFFAGNLIEGAGAMAAVGASGMIVTLLVGFFNGMSVGSSVTVSHAYGEQNREKLSRAVHSAVGIALLGGVVISIVGFFLSPQILRWMQTPKEIFSMASSYIQIYFCSVVSLVFYNIGTGILRATGDSKSPLLFQCIGGVLNVGLDYLFLAVFHWGVNGVAIATLFSQTVPAVLVFLKLLCTKEDYRVSIRKIRIHKEILASILKVGIPAGVQAIVITLSNLFVQAQINSLGTNAIAAFTAYFRIELIMYLPILAYGQAITTFVGQNVGAGRYDRIRKGVGTCLLMGLGTSVLTSGFVLLFARQCFALFNPDPAVVEMGLQFIYINASLYFLYNFLEVFSGAIRGAGNATVPMAIVVGNMCGVRLIALFAMVSLFHSVQAVAVCYPITWFTTSLCLGIYYFCGRLRRKIRNYQKSVMVTGEALSHAHR